MSDVSQALIRLVYNFPPDELELAPKYIFFIAFMSGDKAIQAR
jgi:hypothetical protein